MTLLLIKLIHMLWLTGRFWLGFEQLPERRRRERREVRPQNIIVMAQPGVWMPPDLAHDPVVDEFWPDAQPQMQRKPYREDTLAEILGDEEMPEGEVFASDFFVDVDTVECPKCGHKGATALTMNDWQCRKCLHGWQLETC